MPKYLEGTFLINLFIFNKQCHILCTGSVVSETQIRFSAKLYGKRYKRIVFFNIRNMIGISSD
jgi:hypothetical protein